MAGLEQPNNGEANLTKDAGEMLAHIPQSQYPAAALATAFYIGGGIRGMERGTLSEQRNPDGTEKYADLELVRLAVPRRVFTLSQIKYCADRVKWVYDNRELIGGLAMDRRTESFAFLLRSAQAGRRLAEEIDREISSGFRGFQITYSCDLPFGYLTM